MAKYEITATFIIETNKPSTEKMDDILYDVFHDASLNQTITDAVELELDEMLLEIKAKVRSIELNTFTPKEIDLI